MLCISWIHFEIVFYPKNKGICFSFLISKQTFYYFPEISHHLFNWMIVPFIFENDFGRAGEYASDSWLIWKLDKVLNYYQWFWFPKIQYCLQTPPKCISLFNLSFLNHFFGAVYNFCFPYFQTQYRIISNYIYILSHSCIPCCILSKTFLIFLTTKSFWILIRLRNIIIRSCDCKRVSSIFDKIAVLS